MLDARSTRGERKDLEIYSMAVRAASGELPDWEEEVPREYVAYVEHGAVQHLDGIGRKDPPYVSFNYERWLGGPHS